MSLKNNGWSKALVFTFLTDKSSIGPVPIRLIKAIPCFAFLIVLTIAVNDKAWSSAEIAFSLFIASLSFSIISGLLIFKYQRTRELSLYEEFKGIIFPNVKAEWLERTLESVVLTGSLESINSTDALKILEYVKQLGKENNKTYILINFEKITSGELTAVQVNKGSNEELEFKARLKVFRVFKDLGLLQNIPGFPQIKFESFNPTSLPMFTKVTIEDSQDNIFEAGDIEKVRNFMGRAFTPPVKMSWELKVSSPNKISVVLKRTNLERNYRDQAKIILNNIADEVTSNSTEYFRNLPGEVIEQYYDKNEVLSGFTLVFREVGDLHNNEIFKKYFDAYTERLRTSIPGEWKLNNQLLSHGRVTFKRTQE